jgi:hypothetical protein
VPTAAAQGSDGSAPALRRGASMPPAAGALPNYRYDPARQSGPLIAQAFQRVFALVLLAAWWSLASQVQVLIGSRGLLPAAESFERARAAGAGFWDEPSLLWFAHGDAVLTGGALLGALLAVLALCGVRPRSCFAISAPLYLSYATACSDFTAFQWDNMLVEVALLAACLPAHRPAPLAHFAFRALLFKLYFESGIAKWQSHLHDWQDGSAMRFYYETAPLPAGLAFYAHHLPTGFHRLESWGALVLELIVPFFIWGPRPSRLMACAAFTGFQVINTATANYGFFTYLSVALHLFLLSDADMARVRMAFKLRTPAREAPNGAQPARPWRVLAPTALGVWLVASLISAMLAFSRSPVLAQQLGELEALYAPLRVANVYHLFGSITRERIEPQFETEQNGRWTEHDLRYKPGNVQRRPAYAAPHQPRVDFRLWFYGLSFRQGMPRYVATLLDRLCRDPAAVQPLFARALPRDPAAVRIAFYRYHFASLQEHARNGAYFERELLGVMPARSCH